MGIYNQHFVDRLPMGKTPVEHLRDRYQDEDYQSIRNKRLGKYGLACPRALQIGININIISKREMHGK